MTIDKHKLREFIARPFRHVAPDELRREGNVFFIGGELPPRETLETIFDSCCQTPADLFYLSFSTLDNFHRGEELARLIKKNFSTHLVGRLDFVPPPYIIERAYAAGIDLIDIPLTVFDPALSRERRLEKEDRVQALQYARTVFPRWAVLSTLSAGEEPSCSTVSGIDTLLAAGIVPLVEVASRAAHYPADEIAGIYRHQTGGWRKNKVTVKPLLPLLQLLTPLAAPPRKGLIGDLFDKVYDARLRATSDLRRLLRVRQVEDSFESAGL